MSSGVFTDSLPRLLSERWARGASGVLSAVRGKLRRVFCLDEGYLVFANSNLLEEQLGEFLLRNGLLTPEARDSATASAAREGKKLSQILHERWIVPDEELRRVAEARVEQLLCSCLEWPDGTFCFENGQPSLEGEFMVRLSPGRLVLRHARRFPESLDAVRIRIGPPDLRPALVSGREHLVEDEDLDEVALYLLERCDGTRSIGDILCDSPAEDEATLRGLYGLMLAGLVTAGAQEAATTRSAKDAPLGREECLAVLTRAESADYYGVLGLSRTSRAGQIRSAYYALARRYHPDRFRAGELQDLLPKFEVYFSHVTEAHNTLSNQMRRAEYDEQLLAKGDDSEAAKQTQTPYLARQNFLRGKALVDRRRFAEAAAFLENAVKLDPSRSEYHFELGQLLSRNPRRRAEAEGHLLKAAELEPTSTATYIALGRLYQRAGRSRDAARLYREALRWEPEHSEARRLLAEVGDVPDDGEGGGSTLKSLFGG